MVIQAIVNRSRLPGGPVILTVLCEQASKPSRRPHSQSDFLPVCPACGGGLLRCRLQALNHPAGLLPHPDYLGAEGVDV